MTAICCALHNILCMYIHVGLPLKCCKKKNNLQGKVKARGRVENCWDAARGCRDLEKVGPTLGVVYL